VAGKYDRGNFLDKGGPGLAPVWTEQHGSGAPTATLLDSLQYDGWERVISVVSRRDGGLVAQESFTFDRTGNIHGSGSGEVYDVTTNRLGSRPGGACGATWSYSYDRAGNLTQAVCGSTTWVYGYDALNQLRAVRYNGTLIARYGYDVLGRRIAKRVYTSVTGGAVAYTRFVYHGGAVAFETDTSGTTITLRYTWGPRTDELLGVTDGGGHRFYVVSDVLGSVRGLVKRDDGTWVMSQRFGAYGATIARDTNATGPGFALRYAWTGREYDAETGWYFHRSRYYDPSVRRFVQEDPIGHGGGANVYAYAEGRVMEARDPSGLLASDDYYQGAALKAMHEAEALFWDLRPHGDAGNILVDGAEVSSQLFAAMLALPPGVLGLAPDPFGRNAFLRPTQSEVNRAIALVYNETRGLGDGPNNDLQAARAAVAEVVLNGGRMNAIDHLTMAEQVYIWGDDNGNGQRLAEIMAYRSSAEAVAWAVANRGALDPTGGARFLDIYSGGYNHYTSRGIPALLSYGPFYNAGGTGGGQRCTTEPCAYVYIYTRY